MLRNSEKVVSYRRFGTKCRSRLEGSKSLKVGTDNFSRNVGEKVPFYSAILVIRGQISVLMQAALEIHIISKLPVLKSTFSKLETSQMCRRVLT